MLQNKFIAKGFTDSMILSILAEEDLGCLETTQKISKRSGHQYDIKFLQLLPYLYRLSEDGYISRNEEFQGKRRIRIYYHLEQKGREILAQYYDESVAAIKGLMTFFENS